LLRRVMNNGKLYVALTEKATGWNHSEKNPRVGKKSESPRKKIRITSEKNPSDLGNFSDVSDNHDQITSDQITSDQKSTGQGAAPVAEPHEETGSDEAGESTAGTGAEPPEKPAKVKRAAPASRETWNAYAAAYFDRYGVEPVRNARVNAQIAQFVQRVGQG